MAKPIHNLQLSQRSIDALNEIRHDIGLSKIGLTFISTGHVISLIMGNSGNISRVITIAFSEWEDYQRLSDWGGVAAIYINTILTIIQKKACLMTISFPEGDEKEFWKGLAGEGCRV